MTHTFTDRQKRTWTLRKAPSTEARAKRGEIFPGLIGYFIAFVVSAYLDETRPKDHQTE
jgi:hypothetical protein